MDNLGRDIERMMWFLVGFGVLIGAGVGYVIQRILRG